MRVSSLIVLAGFLSHVWPVASISAQTTQSCEDQFYESRNYAEITKRKCLDDVRKNFSRCMAFPNNLFLGIRGDCNRSRKRGRKLCAKQFTFNIETARNELLSCREGDTPPSPPQSVVITDSFDIPDPVSLTITELLSGHGLASGETFDRAGQYLKKTLPGYVQILHVPESGNFNPEKLLESYRESGEKVESFYLIGHGLDGQQKLGDDLLRDEYLDSVCEAIKKVAAPGAAIILGGCNVGANPSYAQEIADKTGCFVYADPDVVHYSLSRADPNPAIDLSQVELLGIPQSLSTP